MIKQISYFPVLSKFFEVTVINRAIPFEYNVLYKNAKPMYLVYDVDNQDVLKDIIIDTCIGLK